MLQSLVASRGRLTLQRAWPRHGNEADTRAHRGAVPQPDVSRPDATRVSRPDVAPNHGGGLLPFTGRWRPKPRRLGAWQPAEDLRPHRLARSAARRARRARSGRRSGYATRSSTRRCRRCPARSPCCRAATRTPSTRSSTICSWSIAATPDDGRRWRRSTVVGTYRVLRQEVADLYDGFYTQGEYDIAPLIQAKGAGYSFMELGRSCVLKPYRNKRTLELLWQGVWTYVREHGADVMIGCASFAGTDPKAHAAALSYLHHTALAPEDWRVRAHEHLRVDMNMMPREAINVRAAIKALPPLDQGLSAGRRLCRRRRGHRPSIRHDRRLHHHAGRGDQHALFRPFRRAGRACRARSRPSSPRSTKRRRPRPAFDASASRVPRFRASCVTPTSTPFEPASDGAVGLRELNERSREMFKRIVETYLATGEPVGSRNLSRALPMTLSPASVRNVMSDLEALGLIYAPHTSAGQAADPNRLAPVHRRAARDRRRERGGAEPDRGPHRRQRPPPRGRGVPRRKPATCCPDCRAAPASCWSTSRARR